MESARTTAFRRPSLAIALGVVLLLAFLARPAVATTETGALTIQSVDELGAPLAGACYALEGPTGPLGPFCDDDGDGQILLVDVIPGDWVVTPVTPPAGYQVPAAEVVAVVVGENTIVDFVFAAVPPPVIEAYLPRPEIEFGQFPTPVVPVEGAAPPVRIVVTPTCAGHAATIVGVPAPKGGVTTIVGTAGNDVIVGTPGPDEIQGLGGNDLICGLEGDDTIDAGAGDDWVDAGAGNDSIYGHDGADALAGGNGDDVLKGLAGTDRLDGGPGRNDYCHGGTEIDKAIDCETAVDIP